MTTEVIQFIDFSTFISEQPGQGYKLIKPLPADSDPHLTKAILLSAGQHLANLDQFLQFAWGDLLNIASRIQETTRADSIRNVYPIIAGMIPASRQVTERTLRTWCDCSGRWRVERRLFHPVTWSHHYRLCSYSDDMQDEMVHWLLSDEHDRIPSCEKMIQELVSRHPEYGDGQPKNTLPPVGVTEAEIAEMDRDDALNEVFELRQQLIEKGQELETYKTSWQESIDLLNKVVAGEVELPPMHRMTWRPVIGESNKVYIRDEDGDTLASTDPRIAAYLRYWAAVNGNRR